MRRAGRGLKAAWAGALAALLAAGCGEHGAGASGDFEPATPDVLTVATEEVPAAGFFEGTKAEPAGGFELALAEALADRFGLERVAVRVVPFATIASGDLDGADIALSRITPTEERDRVLDFSEPYLDASPTALVRAGTTIPDLQAAQELRWGVPGETTLADTLERVVAPDEPALGAPSEAQALRALERRRVDAVLLDMPVAVVEAERSGGELEAAVKLPVSEAIAVALPEGSDNTQAVSSAMRAFAADGTIDDLLEEWIGPGAVDADERIPLLHSTLR